jgi:hypothetical protein
LPSAAGLSERACLNKSFWELFESVSGGDCAARIARGIRERQPFVIRCRWVGGRDAMSAWEGQAQSFAP